MPSSRKENLKETAKPKERAKVARICGVGTATNLDIADQSARTFDRLDRLRLARVGQMAVGKMAGGPLVGKRKEAKEAKVGRARISMEPGAKTTGPRPKTRGIKKEKGERPEAGSKTGKAKDRLTA